MPVSKIVENIESKVTRLLDDNRKLRQECQRLVEQRDKLRTDSRDLQNEVKTLKSQLAKAQLGAGFVAGASDKRAAKARVNRLMREVDNCLTLLGKE